MQLNEYPSNVINKTIKGTLQIQNSELKKEKTIKNVHPIRESCCWKTKSVATKYKFTTVLTKTKDLRGQIRTKQVNKMETSGIVYEVDCKFVFKKVYW